MKIVKPQAGEPVEVQADDETRILLEKRRNLRRELAEIEKQLKERKIK
ncbi:MAG: DUF5320 domain-containing protein [Pyrinomonadaceae bacterium]